MAKQFDCIEDNHARFIAEQHIFFTATAAPTGRVNLSPKGMDALRVLGPDRIIWLNLTGSGNETAGHLLESPRVTLMWCSFTKRPMILRAYGTARAVYPGDADWPGLSQHLPDHRGARQIFDMSVDMVQTSCGYAVPFMAYEGERDTLEHWAASKSDAQLTEHWQTRNATTLDGRPTRSDG
ncbi:pyridoxamine 5'-phosphate oxidase family protein [Thalassococcus sp. S3]|uniref:pyridoxamine 5'-phosphate oxidase family protein n=1 Tax=Thalassococcus sp. S3 TaxID=2017482 RepID=UPI0010245C9E|nr:pyridoxamine 5'-phosphate oxidase family protein [Thalassococcus sp. S3]QBF31319.1 pyridoxamine 5'-phosphate oxidase [Thalassococcus sp. S3]